MAIDPTDPQTFDEDAPGEDGTTGPAGGLETPEADSAEQRTDLAPQRDSPSHSDPATADEADAVEQGRVVPLDEDDYRP
ncbi:hypothetical protein [Streptomyces sp. NPDC060194]|uniref:hypothetical protein n=1 Tax=Streptomyces sp. NPDC060194 TaxID=3347069 RepID=UPI00364A231A